MWIGISGLLIILTGMHVVVDTSACIVTPLWPRLGRHLSMPEGSVLWLYVLWNVSTSFSQFFFGWFADRHQARWLIWAGPCVAVVCMSCIGLATNVVAAAVFLLLGGLGIAAFHPEAAAAAGATSPDQRSRAMAVFAIGGYVGQALGPGAGGGLVYQFGFPGLLAINGLIVVVLIAAVTGSLRSDEPITKSKMQSLPLRAALQGRLSGVLLVLLVQTLRVITTMGIPLTLTFLLDQLGHTTASTGLVTSLFMVGIGIGGVACALAVRKHHERLMLVLLPVVISIPMLILPHTLSSLPLTSTFVLLSGALLGIVLPIMIGYGQQLVPAAPRMASSLTMGVSWGIGGALLAGYMYLLKQNGIVSTAFYTFAATSLASSAVALALPRLEEK